MTATKSQPVTKAQDAIAVAMAQRETMAQAAEECYLKADSPDYQHPFEDLEIMRAAGYGVEDRHRWRERLAVRAVETKELKAVAGTAKQRAAANAALAEAQTALAAQAAQLEKIKADAEAKLAALERAVETAAGKVETIERACAKLRSDEFLPPFAKQRWQDSLDRANPYRVRILNLESELSKLNPLIDADLDSVVDAEIVANYARLSTNDFNAAAADNRSPTNYRIDADKWAAHVEGLRARRDAILAELEPLKAERAKLEAAADEWRNHWIRQNG